jgi:hypothetical protein
MVNKHDPPVLLFFNFPALCKLRDAPGHCTSWLRLGSVTTHLDISVGPRGRANP